jgi:integrase/recombinase XerD
MLIQTDKHTAVTIFEFPDFITDWANEFYKAKIVEGLSERTIIYYKQQIGHFFNYCDAQAIDRISQITPNVIRGYLLWMKETGHNAGGVHGAYRSLRVFLNWFEYENEPAGWRNPIKRAKPPKVPIEPIEPVEVEDVFKLVDVCGYDFRDLRNKAILLFLLDTGARARELLAIERSDINLETGAILIRKGKGHKPRYVFMGERTRAAVAAYLQERHDDLPALWVADDGKTSFSFMGLRNMLIRRSKTAGIEMPSPHDFRRAFALNMLRNGVDLVTLARLMGHTTTTVLWRYLYQITDDLKAAHQKGSPVDRAKSNPSQLSARLPE